jgi:hypothetical protein
MKKIIALALLLTSIVIGGYANASHDSSTGFNRETENQYNNHRWQHAD